MDKSYIQTNKAGWDLRTDIHLESKFYDIPSFLAGKLTLNKPELNLLKDVKRKKLLHLQCHFGLDTLSWGRLGAIPTGVDFSPKAIEVARKLSIETKILAEFIEADVQDLCSYIKNEAFEIAFSSYGVLCWIEKLNKWASGIYDSLKTNGKFVLVEFHPILDLLFKGIISGVPCYFNSAKPFGGKTTGTYTDRNATIEYFEYRWQHPICEVISALLNAGFEIDDFQEYPFSPYKLFPDLDIQKDGCWFSSKKKNVIPYLYSLVVSKR